MRTGGLVRLTVYAMALLAVAFLNLASVQSTVMQATMQAGGLASHGDLSRAAAAEICHVGLPSGAGGKTSLSPLQAHKACPFCDLAANPPLCGAEVVLPQASTIAWTSYRIQRSLGARGPPAFTPNARGPPASTLTL